MTRERVIPMLQELGAEVTEFDVLRLAKAAFTPDQFDAVILDGKLQGDNDGWIWANELYGMGVHVMVHSSTFRVPDNLNPNLPHLDKGLGLQETRDYFERFLSAS